MATTAELYVPSSPSTFSFRPLSAGMNTADTSMAMPNGSFLEVNGFDISTRGPVKHGTWSPALFQSGTTTPLQFTSADPTERIEAISQLDLSDGTTIEVVITNRGLYTMDENFGFTRINWIAPVTVHAISQTATETNITLTGDFSKYYIEIDDKIVFQNVDYVISNVILTGTTQLLITITGVPAMTVGSVFQFYKPFVSQDDQFTDFTIARFKMYFVDGVTRMVWSFDGELNADSNYYLQPHIIVGASGERTVMGAKSITYFSERLYFAGILEDEIDDQSNHTYTSHMNRVRWTEVLNHGNCLAGSYQDLTRTFGTFIKILGMGSLIMSYMSDGIYYGRSSSYTSIPYIFTFIETAGITALGMKAITTYFDGQVFLAKDNLYRISADAQISALGDNVSETLKERSTVGYMSNVSVDVAHSRILVAVSTLTDYNNCMFFFNYRSSGWSYNDQLKFLAPMYLANNAYLYYNMLSATDTYETTPLLGKSYKSLDTRATHKDFYCFMEGYFMEYDESGIQHTIVSGGTPITIDATTELITPDFDFDAPDTDKTALRLSLKITEEPSVRDVRTENIYFTVDGSRDRGLTWKALGKMRIKPGRDEDALNFRLMGSTLRFRIRHGYDADGTATPVVPFTISEVILRLRERSVETQHDNPRE